MNPYFIKSMALFWVLAEMVILVLLLRGIAFIRGEDRQYHRLTAFLGLILIALCFLAFQGEALLSQIGCAPAGIHLYFYKYALWHLFCTMWVVLEGSIMLVVLQAYFLLKNSLAPSSASQRQEGMMPRTGRALTLLAGSAAVFYLLYEYQVFSVMERYALPKQNLKQLYFFYIKLCGMLWFGIEALVAIIGIKTYHLLKTKDPLPHETV